jgi:hypothetical protein
MKRRVYSGIFHDMKKYIPGLDASQYKVVLDNETDPSVIEEVRAYYDTHLPVDLVAWFLVNEPRKSLIFRESYYNQYHFILDRLRYLVQTGSKDLYDHPVEVVGTHVSKSIKFPVYQIKNEEYGLEMILRNNYYDWLVSINSEKPLDFDYAPIFDLFDPARSDFGYQGFPSDKCFGSYNDNHSQFTVELDSNYSLDIFTFIMMNYIKANA